MATPTDYAVTIKINDVDVTEFVPYDSMAFDDYVHTVSSFRMTVENPTGVTPSKNHSVSVVAKNLTGTPTIFLGYIVEVDAKKRDNGITMIYELECADMKVRLQKSVLEIDSLSGSDTDILSGFLSNAYPDLSSLFDFSTNATSLFSDLEFPTANKSILDALNELSELTGVGDWSLDNIVGGETLTTFEGGEAINLNTESTDYPYAYPSSPGGVTPTSSFTTGGNPDTCVRWQPTSGVRGSISEAGATFRMSSSSGDGNGVQTLSNISFDYYANSDLIAEGFYIRVLVTINSSPFFVASDISPLVANTWTSVDVSVDGDTAIFPVDIGSPTVNTDVRIQFRHETGLDYSTVSIDGRIDNVSLDLSPSYASGGADTTQLNWGDLNPADFDIDIDTGDEIAFDIDLALGDYADFNSITVIGGFEDVGIDWTYESDGDQDHFDLELPIDDIIVYKNTGTDGSPTWTAQTLGNWGEDELTGDGGSKDVLYDSEYHWLLFNSNPSNLSKSIRVTGNIEKPVRIRINEVADGDPVFATTIQNSSIKSVDDAVAVGQAALEKQSSIRSLVFKTYEPGLKVGQSISVTDTERGLDESVVIRRISTKWLGASGHAIFEVSCGDDDYSGVDAIIANNDKRSRENTARASINTPTIILLTDDSNVYLTDDDGTLLYHEE